MKTSQDYTTNPILKFHPVVQQWFEESFEQATPPQLKGWPPIFNGENTLILAPTGSGKTLAAFLVCINDLLLKLLQNDQSFGIHTLYISPLKALNYDIERNLEEPLNGIREKANELGLVLPEIQVAVRTGDTPQKERQRMLRQPPHILITTPESLHLLLTSQRAKEILRTVKYVIVDEIHALSENKRGTFLSLLLERLQYLTNRQFIRIGLSATQKPLEKVAQFLGGFNAVEQDRQISYLPRPVTIIDAGMRKEMELQIVSPVEDFKDLPEHTVWPDIYQKLLELIQNHRSTLIFTNNRAAAERITSEINDRAGYELARAHHGSVSKEKRREIEEQLKQGKLPALVATATLELGIDMGAIDLVSQVESPKSVARALQRVGRAGHLYKSASKGRLIPKMRSDLVELAVLTRAMHNGDVTPIKIPLNCLDILAQQIVAMVSIKSWKVDELYHLVRQAYPYRTLPREHFLGVLEMLSGRYPADAFRDFKPRISWDRVNNLLYHLPGSQRLAIMSGGAIPDTGQYGCYLEDGVTKIGELEEEFVYERRLGEVFVLGTNNWRIKKITHDRVIVSPAPGDVARMPFWKGEFQHRDVHLGKLHGKFCQELKQRLHDSDCLDWLQQECDLDKTAAQNLHQYFLDQQERAGTIPDDQTILIESFRDDLSDLQVTILSPFGGRLHLPWKLAILAQFRRQWGVQPESQHSDTGLLFRFTSENTDAIMQMIRSVNSQNVEELIIEELGNSPFFSIRFRHNANRAMLLPRPQPGKRSPLWLQRMRARDLLEIVRQHPSFPIVMETYQESLQDYLAIDELKHLLSQIESGEVKIVVRQGKQPSPFAASLLFEFMGGYMYIYDVPKPGIQAADVLDKDLLKKLLHPELVFDLLDENAIAEVENRLQAEKEGYQARTPTELVELLRRLGDMTDEEISARVTDDWQNMLHDLCKDHRIVKIFIPNVNQSWRWITAEDFAKYRDAFANTTASSDSPESYQNVNFIFDYKIRSFPVKEVFSDEIFSKKNERVIVQQEILERFLRHHPLVTMEQVLAWYPFEQKFVLDFLNGLQNSGNIVKLPAGEKRSESFVYRETLETIRRMTLFKQRREIQPCDTAQFVEFLLRWQHRMPDTALSGPDSLFAIIEKLQGLALPAEIWESEIFGRRIRDYRAAWLDELCSQGEIIWYGNTAGTGSWGDIIFAYREDMRHFQFKLQTENEDKSNNETISKIRNVLHDKGACFINDLAFETGLAPSTCAAALWDMIWNGEVTNDTFAVIRAGKPIDLFRNSPIHSRRRQSLHQYGRFGTGRRYRPFAGSGRWSLLPEPNSEAEITTEILEAIAYQLLQRYGLLCRELYHIEGWAIPWRSIYDTLVRLEWRGEIRRGYFVKGLSGIQFALPTAADELIAYRTKKVATSAIEDNSDQMILINTCDPANLYGAASPLPLLHPLHSEWRLLRHPNNYLILKSGIPILAIESKGARLTPLRNLSTVEKEMALSLLPQLLDDPGGWRRIRSLKVVYWDDQPVRNSEVVKYLTTLGFRNEFKMMVLEKEF